MMIPAYQIAVYDQSLRGAPIIVYLHLLNELDPIAWREVKHLALAARLDYHEDTISDALDTLTGQGYVERQPRTPGAPRLYRLVYSRMP